MCNKGKHGEYIETVFYLTDLNYDFFVLRSVTKYGGGITPGNSTTIGSSGRDIKNKSNSGNAATSEGQASKDKYALFSAPLPSELRNRKSVPAAAPSTAQADTYKDNDEKKKYKAYGYLDNGSSFPYNSNYNKFEPPRTDAYADYQTIAHKKDDTRLKAAEKVEGSIAQMGQLFSQMATLVQEQSETISRIEDDVESGLENTVEVRFLLYIYSFLSLPNT